MKTGSDLSHRGRSWPQRPILGDYPERVPKREVKSRFRFHEDSSPSLCIAAQKRPPQRRFSVLLMLLENQNMEIPGIAIGDAAAASLDAAAARREEERVYDTVLLSEMEYVEDDATYYYQCPCGDMFEITVEDLTNGMTIARCPSCSLKVRVDTPLPSEGKRAGGAEGASSTT